MDERTFLIDLALIFCVASVATIVFQRLRQPAVLGYLIAGLIVGPHVPIPLFADLHRIEQLSELGVILVVFSIGLEFRFAKLRRVLPTSGIAATVQITAMLWLGYGVGRLAGWSSVQSLFLGGIVCISSTMIVVRVLAAQSGDSRVADNALGMLVVQDIAAVVLIAVFSTIATGSGVPTAEVARAVGKLVLFLVVGVVVGMLVVPRLIREAFHRNSAEVLLVAAIGVCFGAALAAEHLGFSVALGAFIAGSVIAESGLRRQVEHLVAPVRDMFAAVFFVSVGMLVDPHAIADNWVMIAAVSGAVIAGHFAFTTVGSVLAGYSVGVAVRTSLVLGQIGEFSFIIAGIGVAAGAVGPGLMAIAVGVSAVTTFTTPMLTRASGRCADAVERRLPQALQTFIALYASWLESLRSRERGTGALVRRNIAMLVLDVIALVGIALAVGLGRHWLAGELSSRAGIAPRAAELVVAGAALALATPFVLGIAFNVRRVGARLAATILPASGKGVDLADAPRRALVVGLELAVSALVVVPLIAVTAPFLPLYIGAIALVVIVAGLGVVFWRSAKNLQGHVSAGAMLLLELVDEQRRADPEQEATPATPAPSLPAVLPGLGPLETIAIEPGAPVVGRALAEINLRARTGATVLALTRADGTGVGVPTGNDRLAASDVLTISGSTDAVERARSLLAGEDIEPDTQA